MPESISSFLKFVKECEYFYLTQQRNPSHPVLIHCMNGVSRSAVFILVYTMIQIIDLAGNKQNQLHHSINISSDLILKLIKQMREKRKYMIQSMHHLKYTYDAVLYYLKEFVIKEDILNITSNSLMQNIMHEESITTGSDTRQQAIVKNTVETGENNSKDSNSEFKQSVKEINFSKEDDIQVLNNLTECFEIAYKKELNEAMKMHNKQTTFTKNENENKKMSLIELCDPNKFTLEVNDDLSKKKKKITKKDFITSSPTSSNNMPHCNETSSFR